MKPFPFNFSSIFSPKLQTNIEILKKKLYPSFFLAFENVKSILKRYFEMRKPFSWTQRKREVYATQILAVHSEIQRLGSVISFFFFFIWNAFKEERERERESALVLAVGSVDGRPRSVQCKTPRLRGIFWDSFLPKEKTESTLTCGWHRGEDNDHRFEGQKR